MGTCCRARCLQHSGSDDDLLMDWNRHAADGVVGRCGNAGMHKLSDRPLYGVAAVRWLRFARRLASGQPVPQAFGPIEPGETTSTSATA